MTGRSGCRNIRQSPTFSHHAPLRGRPLPKESTSASFPHPDLSVAPTRFATGWAGLGQRRAGNVPVGRRGVLASPPPLVRLGHLPLSRRGPGATGTALRVRRREKSHRRSTLMIFPRRLSRHVSILAVRRSRAGRPLLGLSKYAPPPCRDRGVHRTRRRRCRRQLAEPGCQARPRSVLVVSHHLDGFLLLDLAGVLHPASGHGVRRVSTCCEQASPRRVPTLQSLEPNPQLRRDSRRSPTRGAPSPRFTPCRHDAPRSRVPLPPRCWGHATFAGCPVNLEAFLRELSRRRRPRCRGPRLPCSPGLRPRRCRRCHHESMSPPARAPVARSTS